MPISLLLSISAPRLTSVQVFVMSSEKILKQNHSNMYTLMVTNSRSPAAKLVLRAPPKWRPATYLLLHCLLCYLAICAAVSHQPACT